MWLSYWQDTKLYPHLFAVKWKTIFTPLYWKCTDTNKLFLSKKSEIFKKIVSYFKLIPTKGFCLKFGVYFASECLLIQSHKAMLQAKLESQVFQELGFQHIIQRLYFLGNAAIPKTCRNFSIFKLYLFAFSHFLPAAPLQSCTLDLAGSGKSFAASPWPCVGDSLCYLTWPKLCRIHPEKHPPGPQVQPELLPDAAKPFTETRQNDKSMVTLIPLFI